MALRIRSTGEILCAAAHPAEPGDTYLNDGLSYKLTVDLHAIVTEPMFKPGGGGHSEHGQWWWADEVPEDIEIDKWWE